MLIFRTSLQKARCCKRIATHTKLLSRCQSTETSNNKSETSFKDDIKQLQHSLSKVGHYTLLKDV